MNARRLTLAALVALAASGCGGKGGAPGTGALSVVPSSASVQPGGHQQFQARVGDAVSTAVTWTVQEGSGGGSVSATGLYTAPASISATTTYHVVATSTADASKSASASVTVTSSASGTSPAAALAAKLGRASRLLIGTGAGAHETELQAQQIPVDILERYLVVNPWTDWTTWNANGTYVDVVAEAAESVGAVPMYSLYQMAMWGDGNLGSLADATAMSTYWAHARLFFQRLGLYGKPALVNLEPDFWGYSERSSGGDPTRLAVVALDSECSDLARNVQGMALCLIRLARTHAPKALIGYSPSDWGGNSTAEVIAWLRQVGAPDADFVVMQTLDRDAGCFEARIQDDCIRDGGPWYWDETNTTSPNFHEHLALARTYYDGLGKPLVWWQTPFGVPSSTPGGTSMHYRDNRVHYMFSHPDEFVAAGGVALVFGTGAEGETDITSDGGQFQRAAQGYLAHPTPLP